MYLEDTAAYLDNERKKRILEELHFNAFRTIKSVYLFKHFDEYVEQLHSDKNEGKKEVYWNASYYEKLIDYVKISIAFETYNKAVLLDKGILVHKIKSNKLTKSYSEIQKSGLPIIANDIVQTFGTSKDYKGKIFLNGLTEYFQTIKYSDTLKGEYQKIIGLDKDLIHHLIRINENRNRLHFFTDFKGAFEVNRHIKKWQFIMEKSVETIELPLKLKRQSSS